MRLLGLFLVLAAGCAGRASVLPDYSELLAAGVEPIAEAEVVEATLTEAGFVRDERAEGVGFVALGLARGGGGERAVRIVTTRGVAFALDSDPSDPLAPAGAVHLRTTESGTDVDGDGRLDLVVSRVESDRECLLVLALTEDGGLEALRVDGADLEPSACLEAFDDVGGAPGIEAVTRLRARALRRTRMPTADVLLERDEAGVYGRRPPPVAYLAAIRARLSAALVEARARRDEDETYTLAVEAALIARAAGEAREEQMGAFDDAVASVVWSAPLLTAIRAAREHISRGWR